MDSAQIEREACGWLAKRDTEYWSEADCQAFAAWQDRSTAHRIAVIRIQTIWHKADRLQALGAGVPRGQIPPPGSSRYFPFFGKGTRSTRRASVGDPEEATSASRMPKALRALAAALVLGVGAVSAWYFTVHDRNSYRSAVGDTKVVSLADGSTITLNTNSAIHVALTAAERRIDLDRGEAFFEVAKDSRRPFIVSTAGKRIIAVGTKFSVFRGDLDTRVVVTQGQVKVEELQSGLTVGPGTQLTPGSIAQAGSAGVVVRHASIAEAETYVSWRSGYIALRDTELTAAVAEFNRYNHKQLVIADTSIAEIRIGGNLRATNVDAFVRVLKEGFAVRAEDQGDRVVLTAKPR